MRTDVRTKASPVTGSAPVSGGVRRTATFLLVLAALNLILVLTSFLIGRFPVPPGTVLHYAWDSLLGVEWQGDPTTAHVISVIRLPRLLAAMLIGAALSMAGAAYQSLFRNPLVSPDVLGATSGAGFGASLAIIGGAGALGLQFGAFVGALLAVLGAWTLSRFTKRDPILSLVLCGIVVGAMFSAGTSSLKYVADPNDELPAITFWLMGGLTGVSKSDVIGLALPVLACGTLLWLVRWQLDAATFGDETATALGVHITALRGLVIVLATLLTGVAVAVGGVIGWVGLLIPHVVRMVLGPEHYGLIPASALLGSAFLLSVDSVARTALHAEIPLGILTSFIGAPFLAAALLRRQPW